MKHTVIFGGTGGIGSKLFEYFHDEKRDTLSAIGTSACNLRNYDHTREFINNLNADNLIILSALNINGMLHKQTINNITEQIEVNITGILNLISAALTNMRFNKYGRIILASSIIEEVTQPGTSIYSSCKGFYETLVKNIAKENAALNITANCIKFGYMDAGMIYTQVPDNLRETIRKTIPSETFGPIEQVFNLCRTIIDNDYINGATIRMAGGL